MFYAIINQYIYNNIYKYQQKNLKIGGENFKIKIVTIIII